MKKKDLPGLAKYPNRFMSEDTDISTVHEFSFHNVTLTKSTQNQLVIKYYACS